MNVFADMDMMCCYSPQREDVYVLPSMCICLSKCQKLIISSLHHILYSPGGVWTHSGMSACPSGPKKCN